MFGGMSEGGFVAKADSRFNFGLEMLGRRV
jgi:hypothetical protein